MDKAGDIFERGIAQALNLVQQAVIKKFTHLFKRRIHFPEITQKSSFGIHIAPQDHLHIEGVAMQAAIFGGAGAQMVGGIEGEALGELDHGRHIASRPVQVKDGHWRPIGRDSLAFAQILRARKAHANWHARCGGDSRAANFCKYNQTVKSGEQRQMEASAPPPV
jgi:hypothetical protein